MAHPNTKEELIAPLSQTLTSKESSLSFCLFCFLLFMVVAKQRVKAILCPWKTNERREMKKKMKKKTITNGNQKCKIHNTKEDIILLWRFTSNQKNMFQTIPPKKNLKIKHSLCRSFIEFILLLTHCQWFTVSYQFSLNLSLNIPDDFLHIFDDFIHFSMTYPLQIAEVFQHMLYTNNEQHNAKVSVKIMSEKPNIFPTYSFPTSCEMRFLPHLLGEKSTHFLLFPSLSPHPSHPSIVSAPINSNSLNSSNSTAKIIAKHTPWNERSEKSKFKWLMKQIQLERRRERIISERV